MNKITFIKKCKTHPDPEANLACEKYFIYISRFSKLNNIDWNAFVNLIIYYLNIPNPYLKMNKLPL